MANNFIDKYNNDIRELQLAESRIRVYTDGKHKFIYFKQEEQELSVDSLDLHAFNW